MTPAESVSGAQIERAQKLRLKRMLWGFANHGCTAVVVAGLLVGDYVPLEPALVFAGSTLLIGIALVLVVRFGVNLRFRDPSMTMVQLLWPLLPSLHVMYYIPLVHGRSVFLLLATGGLLFGTLGLDRRQMLIAAGAMFGSYAVLLAIIAIGDSERLHWPIEVITLFAYAAVLSIVAYLGSFISGLRAEVRQKNRSLKKANLELIELATRDPLTSLPNRRAVMEQFEKEAARFSRHTPGVKELGISILDIDHFKRVNDTYGHQAGDAILRKVGQALQATVRKGDYVGRIGGEEFLLLFPETSFRRLEPTAERIRRAVAALTFDELPPGERITVSQGTAILRTGETVADTFRRADEALYLAKEAGRNRAILSGKVDEVPV